MDDENENEALPAPYQLGDCVEYIGPNTWQLGRGPVVRPGDVGVVVEVDPPGADGDEDNRPEHGRSAVEFHGSRLAQKWIRARSGSRFYPEYRKTDCL